MTGASCPRCSSGLHLCQHGALGVGPCFGCGGLWLSAEAARTVEAALFEGAVQAATSAGAYARTPFPEAQRGGGALACPSCRQPMERWPIGDVEVDHCRAHGTWYDRGELLRVQRHLARQLSPAANDPGGSGLELARAPTRKKAALEQRAADKRLEVLHGMMAAEAAFQERARERISRQRRSRRRSEAILDDTAFDYLDCDDVFGWSFE